MAGAETVAEVEQKVTTQSSETVPEDPLPTEMQTAKDRDEAKGDHQEEGKDNKQKKEAETVDEEERKVTTQSSETVTADPLPTEMQTAKDRDEKREIVNAKVQERGTDKETDRNQAPSTNNRYQEAGGALKPGASPENQDHQNEDASQTELTHNNGENSTSEDTEGEEEEGDSDGNAMREKPTGRTGEAVETEGAEGHKEEKASNKNQTAKTTEPTHNNGENSTSDGTEGEEDEGDSDGNAMREKPTGRTGEAVETEGAEGHKEEKASNKNQTAKTSKQDTENIEEEEYDGNKDKNGADTSSNKKKSGSEIDEEVDSVESPTGDSAKHDFSKMLASPEQALFSPSSLAGNTSTPGQPQEPGSRNGNDGVRRKKQSSHHNAESHGDSRMGKSLSASSSTSGNFVDPEQDHSLTESVEELIRGMLRLEVTKKSREEDLNGGGDHGAREALWQSGRPTAHGNICAESRRFHLSDRQEEEEEDLNDIFCVTEDIQLMETQNHKLTNQQKDEIVDRDRLNEEIQQLKTQNLQLVDQREQQNALSVDRDRLKEEIVQLQASLCRLTNERDELQITSQKQVSQLTGDRNALRAGCDRLNGLVEKLTDVKACLEGAKNDLEGAAGGTTIKFNPPFGQDTISKSGVCTNINTRHQCITAMNKYENKSMEELRMEDYTANRKGKQTGTATSFFGQSAPQATQASNTGFSFGQPGAASTGGFLFGSTNINTRKIWTRVNSTFRESIYVPPPCHHNEASRKDTS